MGSGCAGDKAQVFVGRGDREADGVAVVGFDGEGEIVGWGGVLVSAGGTSKGVFVYLGVECVGDTREWVGCGDSKACSGWQLLKNNISPRSLISNCFIIIMR